ncbi:MAG: type II toxin-antitoxin system prevent-host-death family antitoxin [Sphingopyxis sp.]|uniref:type II toxin-antitoxin system Phd/YefM family antitoxin n=1 Tax=Sphingopyxis sp. TaxID=1908224 RepID=UPI001A258131|nr:type II toxin-antitoxin system prevent-host-death family antitoxin [Sphingopyxis sp.]MBJ7499661.1 type II toxin-antitoxin system prevent-host-death family antitoxin [Sphingopyxis sp.]
MPEHSVAEAKNGLPGLIDKARAGEQVIITRHGRPVAELRAIGGRTSGKPSHYSLLKRDRDARKAVDVSSVELLRQMYEDE